MSPTIHYSHRVSRFPREKTSSAVGRRGRIHKSMNANGRTCAWILRTRGYKAAGYISGHSAKTPGNPTKRGEKSEKKREETKWNEKQNLCGMGQSGTRKLRLFASGTRSIMLIKICVASLSLHLRLCLSLFIYPFIFLHLYPSPPSICLYLSLSIRLFLSAPIYLPVSFSFYLFIRLFQSLSIRRSLSLFISLSVLSLFSSIT